MNVKNIIFDLDGTLVDSFVDIYQALKTTSEDLGLFCPPENEVRGRMHLRLDQLVKVTFPEADEHMVMERFRVIYDRSGYPKTKLFPGVKQTLMELRRRNYRMFVATNKRRVAAVAILARLDDDGTIERIVSSDTVSPPVDKKGQIKMIIRDQVLEPRSTVMVGDTMGDWKAALDNDVAFVLAGYGYGDISQEETVRREIRTITSFPDLLHVIQDK